MRNLIVYNDVAFPSDTANTPNSAVERDASGNIAVSQVSGTAAILSQKLGLGKTAAITTNTTISLTGGSIVRADASGGNVTLTLPLAAVATGVMLWIKRVDASGNTLTVQGNGGTEMIDAATSTTIAGHGSLRLFCNGTSWDVV